MFRGWRAAAVIAALTVTGCSGPDAPGPPNASKPKPSVSASPSKRPATPTATAVVGPTYHAAGLNVCAKIDVRPLSDWKLTVKEDLHAAPPEAAASSVSAGCEVSSPKDWYLLGYLSVEVTTSRSEAEAGNQAFLKRAEMGVHPAYDQPDIGDESYAFFNQAQDEFGYPSSDYTRLVRIKNLVVAVGVHLMGVGYPPVYASKAALVARTLTILRAMLAAVPKS